MRPKRLMLHEGITFCVRSQRGSPESKGPPAYRTSKNTGLILAVACVGARQQEGLVGGVGGSGRRFR